ncbi:FHA domain-containing serine/threonine-protein kinase [Aspergillus affinis]|uniref:FHA domain-containing serine/threonine-protein kinase n=1 Tax=Aspergillus affinis TaxID=1070780 RepID=UPI0022FE8BF2|nr:Pkinase-domain-containing protein [Aspergillus affinis]KAI9040616.1 Pkinase-domain-containing protein [Aspergillus affinis]
MATRPQFFLESPSSPYVGTLSVWDPVTRESTQSRNMYSNQNIYVGRDPSSCDYVFPDMCVSRKHIHIYPIIFDRDNPHEVAPLVYAQNLSRNCTRWNGHPMGNKNRSFLLSHGDILHLDTGFSLRYTFHNHRDINHLDSLQSAEAKIFADIYTITQRKLGSGAYGKVLMAFRNLTGQQFACKIIDLRVLKERFVQEAEARYQSRSFGQVSATGEVVAVRRPKNLQEKLAVYDREAEILEGLSHPNIIGIERVIKSKDTIYLFQELITAGDLFSYIQFKGGRLPEIEAAVIVRQVSMALEYLHERNIVHRDLKPDNILMTSLADGCRVVLTDFGCAQVIQPSLERMSTVVGTFDYSAPEVLQRTNQGYTKAVDLWSLGCVTFVLLTGDIPFRNELTTTIGTDLVRTASLEQLERDLESNGIRQRAADFIRRLLVFDETKRMDVKQALGHNWFSNRSHKTEFEMLYERAMKIWRPYVRKGPLNIEWHDLIGDSTRNSEAQDSQSRLPDDTMRTQGLNRSHSIVSATLSDPILAPHHRLEGLRGSQSFILEGVTSQSQSSSIVAESGSSGRSTSLNEYTQSSRFEDIGDHQEDRQPEGPYSSNLGARNTEMAGLVFPDDLLNPRQRLGHNNDGDGEVYEETTNWITGMKERHVYGSNVYREEG